MEQTENEEGKKKTRNTQKSRDGQIAIRLPATLQQAINKRAHEDLGISTSDYLINLASQDINGTSQNNISEKLSSIDKNMEDMNKKIDSLITLMTVIRG